MDVTKTLDIPLKDAYQLLIGECRYGYSRNNHLMPSCAYDKVKRIVPQMYEVDKEYAVYTLKQICEECISDQLTWHFYDGEDDEHGNRAEAIEFINWCLQWIHTHETDKRYEGSVWLPYNMDQFSDNLAKDNEPRYLVYELRGKSQRKRLITPEPVSKKQYLDVVFAGIEQGTYRNERIKVSKKLGDRRRHYVYHIIEPIKKDFYIKHI